MNPSITPSIIEQAYEEDESSARAEYGAEFRRDIETYISKEAVDAVTIPGRRELPYSRIHQYFGFVDPSGGSNDSMTLAISHRETINAKDLSILDLVREIRPPFSPESATAEFAQLLQSYGISTVKGDRYAGEFPRELFRKCGITYETSDKTKSEIYQALLPLLNSQRVELLDHPRLISQLCNLERRTARSGRDSIDHAPLAHDDVVNAAAGALVAATGPRYTTRVVKIVGF